jgi:Tol biopolymer transport system component
VNAPATLPAISASTETPAPPASPTATDEPPTLTATIANPFPKGLIAFSCGIGADSGNNRLFLSSPDGSFQIEIPNQPGNSLVAALSRDGRRIAYRSNATGSYQIYASNLDGTNRRQITSGDYNNYEAVWSPDDSQFAFVSDRDGSRQIYTMNSDGSNQTRLTFNDAYNDDPSWSVNDAIIFESNVNGRFSLFQISPTGGTPLELITLGSSSSTPAWSHDGQWLAFESLGDGDRDIWIAQRDGSTPRRVAALGSSDERPAWSPDGTNIAIHSNYLQADSDDVDIWVMNIESQTPLRLTDSGNCYDPSWAIVPIDMLVNLIAIAAPTPSAPTPTGIDHEPYPLNSGTAVTVGDDAFFWQLETFDGTIAGLLWELRLNERLNTGE